MSMASPTQIGSAFAKCAATVPVGRLWRESTRKKRVAVNPATIRITRLFTSKRLGTNPMEYDLSRQTVIESLIRASSLYAHAVDRRARRIITHKRVLIMMGASGTLPKVTPLCLAPKAMNTAKVTANRLIAMLCSALRKP